MIARTPRAASRLVRLAACGLALAAAAGAAPRFPAPALEAGLARVDSLLRRQRGDSARVVLGTLERAVRASGDRAALARVLAKRGESLAGARYSREAEPPLREAVALATAAADTATLATSMRWLAVALEDQGRADEASALYPRVLALGRAAGLDEEQAWALVGIAWRHYREGRPDSTIHFDRNALPLFARARSLRGEAWARNQIGLAYDELGNVDSARVQFVRTAALAETLGFFTMRTWAYTNLGAAESRYGDPVAAVRAYRRALEYPDVHSRFFTLAPVTVNLARAYAQLGAFRDAERLVDSSLAIAEAEGYRELVGLFRRARGDVEQIRGRSQAAIRWYRAALALGDSLRDPERVAASLSLAEALAGRDSLAEALAISDATLADLRGRIANDSRLSFEVRRGELLTRLGRPAEAIAGLQAAAEVSRAVGPSGVEMDARLQLARALRRLGRRDEAAAALEEAYHAWEADRGLPSAPEWRELRGQSALEVAYEDADLALEGREHDAAQVAHAFAAVQRFKARTLYERATGPGGGALAAERFVPVPLARLQREVLEPGETFLDYLVAPRGSLAFVVTRDRARVLRLPPLARLSEEAAFFRELVVSRSPDDAAASRALAERLGATLLGGEAPAQGTLLVSADGPLHTVPFAALRVKAGAAPLGEDCDIACVPSATLLARMRARTQRPAAGLLVVAGGRDSQGRALPGAEHEARWLASRFDGAQRYAVGGAAPPALERFGQLHFAVHTRVNDQHPWATEIPFGRAPLHAHDVARLRLEARVAVLSSCESAAGRAYSGEGVAGLASAFMAAGVPAVVASLWPVDDAATRDLMEAFYDALGRGEPVARALRSAQRTVAGRPKTADPFYWAGFVTLGDPSQRPALVRRGRGLERSALVLLGVALAVGGAVWMARRRVAS